MSDIVLRLRSSAKQAGHSKEWDAYAWLEAADKIESLRAEIETERDSQISAVNNMLKAEQDNERLRAALVEVAERALTITTMRIVARAALEPKE